MLQRVNHKPGLVKKNVFWASRASSPKLGYGAVDPLGQLKVETLS